MQHPIYIFNLPERKDRLEAILEQFEGRKEFDLHIIQPEIDSNPRRSLWQTLVKLIINKESDENLQYIIICEDDHLFTKDYSPELLNLAIKSASDLNADVLLGGVSWQKGPYQVLEHLFFITEFTGLQFTVIFKKFFNTIIAADFSKKPIADKLISSLSDDKYLIYPPISVQQEFGYSDLTPMNNRSGRVDFLFKNTENILYRYDQIRSYYSKTNTQTSTEEIDIDNVTLPVYVFNHEAHFDGLENVKKQFFKKDEFDLHIISPKDCGNLSLWKMIVNGVERAAADNEDFFILCKSNHDFTSHYTKDRLIENIIEAYIQRADILLGGAETTGICVPIAQNRYWIDSFKNSSYIIVFKHFYQKICSYEIYEDEDIDKILSKLSVNKMIIYPFISNIKGTSSDESQSTKRTESFNNHEDKYALYQKIHHRFLSIRGKE
jgi:GR25 family glycosyltransferase involved in LPS biosynthesis